jgi:hypothetical protein
MTEIPTTERLARYLEAGCACRDGSACARGRGVGRQSEDQETFHELLGDKRPRRA